MTPEQEKQMMGLSKDEDCAMEDALDCLDDSGKQAYIHRQSFREGFLSAKQYYAAALASVEVEWVTVTEDGPWPEDSCTCMVHFRNGDETLAQWKRTKGFFSHDYALEDEPVIAYAPINLPAPYKEPSHE